MVVCQNAWALGGGERTSLDLVADQEDVVLGTQLSHPPEISVVRHDNARLALDGLDKEGGNLAAVRLEGLLEVLGMVEAQQLAGGGRHGADAGNVGAVVGAAFRVGAHRHGAKGAAVEVLGNTQHERLVFGDLLGLVAPLACNLNAGFDRLGARVHREDHVESEILQTRLARSSLAATRDTPR